MDRRGPDPDRTNDITLETERLVLDTGRDGDDVTLYSYFEGENRRLICDNLVWDGPDSLDVVTESVQATQTRTFGERGFAWIVRDRTGSLAAPGTPLGSASLRPGGHAGRANLGYWLAVPFWRKGVMSEALGAIVELGFGELNIHRIEASVFSFNTASRALLESLGFQHEGVLRSTHFKGGKWIDDAMYSMLHHEWEPR